MLCVPRGDKLTKEALLSRSRRLEVSPVREDAASTISPSAFTPGARAGIGMVGLHEARMCSRSNCLRDAHEVCCAHHRKLSIRTIQHSGLDWPLDHQIEDVGIALIIGI